MRKYLLCSLGCMGLAMAFYAGIWTFICEKTGMLSWIGFAGCTTYFACGKKNQQGIGTAAAANLSGVVWAMLSIVLGNVWECSYKTVLLCAFISYMIIMQSRMKFLAFIPGAYIGCFITFAAEGNWRAVLPALVLGVILGWMTDVTSTKLYHWIGNGRSMQEESSLLPSEIK